MLSNNNNKVPKFYTKMASVQFQRERMLISDAKNCAETSYGTEFKGQILISYKLLNGQHFVCLYHGSIPVLGFNTCFSLFI